MTRIVAVLYSLLLSLPLYAEEVKDVPPPEQTNVVGIVIFFGLFIGLCAGFFGYMWWRHKQGKEE